MDTTPVTFNTTDLFQEGGQMGALMRAYDWRAHPLGDPHDWPQSLKNLIRLMLHAPYPMFIWWSWDLYMFHNDPYLPALGKKHPEALGAQASHMWAEIWWQIGGIVERILAGGDPFYAEELQMYLERKGFQEETYWTFSYSAAFDDAGKVGGMFCVCHEATPTVLARRRLNTLKNLAEVTQVSHTVEEVSGQICQILDQNPKDIPFGLIYLLEEGGKLARLTGQCGSSPFGEAQPVIELTQPVGKTQLPVKEVLESRQKRVIVNILPGSGNQLEGNTGKAAILLLTKSGQPYPIGFFIAGISPQLEYNPDYENFHELVADHITTALREVINRQEADRLRNKLYSLFMEAPAPISILSGKNLVYELVNPAYQQAFPGRELLGKPLLEAMPEVANTRIYRILENVLETGKTFVAQEMPVMLARSENGPLEEIYWTFTYQARFNEQGQVDGVLIFAFEVTQQVRARKEVEDNARQLKLITDALPVLIGYIDKEHKYRFANLAYEQWFQQKPEALLGRPVREVVGDEAYQEVRGYINRALSGERLDFEARMPYRQDFVKYIRTSYIPDYQQGKVLGFYTLVTDITEQVVARQKIEEREKEAIALAQELKAANEHLLRTNEHLDRINNDLDNFVYAASHDLKAPIHNIEGLVKILLRSLPEEALQLERVQYSSRMIAESVERFKRTINHLTEVSKLQKETNQIAVSISLAKVVEEVILDLEPLIEATQATLEVQVVQCPEIEFSEKNLRSIIYNLLSNAIKYHSPNRLPVVKVHYEQADGFYALKVEDNGLGMDLSAGKEEKLFAMFKRFHDHVEGSGIGLYMVKKIVENAGGKIEVKSRVGEGSTFTVYFKQRLEIQG